MNNLYRDLAPVTEEAWEEIELEARRTFKRHIAGRPGRRRQRAGGPGRRCRQRRTTHRCQSPLRRRDHPPPRQASRLCGFAFHSRCRVRRSTTSSAGHRIPIGTRSRTPPRSWRLPKTGPSSRATKPRPRSRASAAASSNPALTLPADHAGVPRRHLAGALRARGWPAWTGRTRCCCPPTLYTRSQRDDRARLPDPRTHPTGWFAGDIIWAPAIDGAFVLTTRGGDFDLQLGHRRVDRVHQSHDAEAVQLYHAGDA